MASEPKRSLLAQERSRETRRSIVRAALELWNERGYETGVDDTTAEEIATRAGVAKGTFYFHFARKEDILRETGLVTARVFYDDALLGLSNNEPLDELLDGLMRGLARRIEKSSRSALRRILIAQGSVDDRSSREEDRQVGFDRAFVVIFSHAQDNREIPAVISADRLGRMFSSLTMDALREWAFLDDVDLTATLLERTAFMTAGARAYAPTPTAP